MSNIWGFVLQTISVSLVAALLLIIKWLFHDKLSPRWQYGVWAIVALRILLPVSVLRYVVLPVPLWLETVKAMAEKTLTSAFSAAYDPIAVNWPLPLINSQPVSLTDWLLVVYAAGIVITLLWYLIAYTRLRLLLRRGAPASAQLQGRVAAVCAKYGLRGCQIVTVPGLPSAFICGVFRPVLAVPAGAEPDEKIILHELLHLKYNDGLQSILWCLLRALHWCNPFLHYVFDRVGNDMEALCDQRVLERLAGEERREYGRILLDMANERYPRAPGTTSLSNGGKNIARRIDAIVRFKLYPRGMALVSVCIAIVLACPALLGTASAYGDVKYRPNTDSSFEQAMAMARIQRCTTVAGALDTYAKGLMYENGIYIATASSLARHQALATEMRRNVAEENWVAYHLDRGWELTYVDVSEGYYVYNLKEDDAGNYQALLALSVKHFLNENGEGWLENEAGDPYDRGAVSIPVTISYEDGWVVEESGERLIHPGSTAFDLSFTDSGELAIETYAARGVSGSVTVYVVTAYTVSNTVHSDGWSFLGGERFDDSVKTGAQFERGEISATVVYQFGGTEEQRQALTSAGYEAIAIFSPDDEPQFSSLPRGKGVGGSSEGRGWSNEIVDEDWDGVIRGGSGGYGEPSTADDMLVALPDGYGVRIFWNGAAVEEFVLKGAGE